MSGVDVVKYVYDAWGNCETVVLDESCAVVAKQPFGYRSYFFDRETNLYYLQTRYYDPETGRFVSEDSVEYLDPETINGLNLFAYCANNPVMNVDPTGTSALVGLIIGAIIGVVISAVMGGVFGGITEMAAGGNFMDGFWGGMVTGAVSAIGLALGLAVSVFYLLPGLGLGIAISFGAIGGALGSFITEGLKNDWNLKNFDLGSIIISVFMSAITNLVSFGIAGIFGSGAGEASKKFIEAFLKALSFSPATFVALLMVSFPMFALGLIPIVIWDMIKKRKVNNETATSAA